MQNRQVMALHELDMQSEAQLVHDCGSELCQHSMCVAQ